MSVPVLALALALAAPVPKGAETDRWVGKAVFRKDAAVRLTVTNDAGAETQVYPSYVSYRVVADEGERVRVIHNGKPAWFRKDDVVRGEEAVEHFTRMMQAEPNNTSWRLYRGSAYREVGKIDEGIKDYDALIEKFPQIAVYWNNRASLKITAKRYDSAIADLDKALEIQPGYPIALRNRGHARLLKKDYDAAIADLDQAIGREPANAGPYVYRAQCREGKGEFAAAEKDLAEAVRLEPLNALALNALAWLRATSPDEKLRDGAEAVKLAERACDLTDWRTGSYLDTLAAACAEAGRFADAVAYQEAALRDKKFAADKGAEAKDRLALYKQGKPYRQPGKK